MAGLWGRPLKHLARDEDGKVILGGHQYQPSSTRSTDSLSTSENVKWLSFPALRAVAQRINGKRRRRCIAVEYLSRPQAGTGQLPGGARAASQRRGRDCQGMSQQPGGTDPKRRVVLTVDVIVATLRSNGCLRVVRGCEWQAILSVSEGAVASAVKARMSSERK